MNVNKLAALFCSLAKLETIACLHLMVETLASHGYTIDICSKDHYAICDPPKPCKVGLVAHCDTVAPRPPDVIANRCGVLTVQGGGVLGADDRAGCAAILATVLDGKRPQIYLFTGEERGGIGADYLAYHTDYAPPDSLHVLLELDRQGGNDFVTYDCESKQLDKWVSRFGFEKSVGSFSDISIIAPLWGVAAANLSVGYYDQHTRRESLIVPQLAHTVQRVAKMIDTSPKRLIEYVEAPRYTRSTTVSGYGSLYTSKVSSWPPSGSHGKAYDDDEPLRLGLGDDTALESYSLIGTVICENCRGRVSDYLELDGSGWCEDCVAEFNLQEMFRNRVAADDLPPKGIS